MYELLPAGPPYLPLFGTAVWITLARWSRRRRKKRLAVQRMFRRLDSSGVTVHDGALLEQAVRVLVKHAAKK